MTLFFKLLLLSIALVIVLLLLWANWQAHRQTVLFVYPDAAGQWWWQAKARGEVGSRNGPFDTRDAAYDAGTVATFVKKARM